MPGKFSEIVNSMRIQCDKCVRNSELPGNSIATKVKCQSGDVLSKRSSCSTTASGRCFNVVCSSCHASLSVSAGASAKQVKRKCGKPNHVGRATDTPNPLRSSISFHGPGHQNAGGELDVLNSVYLVSSPVVKHPVFVQQPDSSTDEVQLAPKPCFRISNNLAYPETTDANMVN